MEKGTFCISHTFARLINYQSIYSSNDSPNYLALILCNYFSLCESWLTSIFRSMDSSVASVPNHENITGCRHSPIMQILAAFRFTGFLVQLSLLPTRGAGHTCASSLLFAEFIHFTLELCRLGALSMMTYYVWINVIWITLLIFDTVHH